MPVAAKAMFLLRPGGNDAVTNDIDVGRHMATKSPKMARKMMNWLPVQASPHARMRGHETPLPINHILFEPTTSATEPNASKVHPADSAYTDAGQKIRSRLRLMSLEIRGSAVVRIPVPETLIKVTPVMMVMIQNDSSVVFPSLLPTEGLSDDILPCSLGSSISGFTAPLTHPSCSGSSAKAGAVVVTVVTVVTAVIAVVSGQWSQ